MTDDRVDLSASMLRIEIGESIKTAPLAERLALLGTVEAALGLTPQAVRRNLAQRDAAIRDALENYYEGSPSGRSKALAADLKTYLGGGYMRERHLTELDTSASLKRRALHRIASFGCGHELGWRQILNVCEGHRGR